MILEEKFLALQISCHSHRLIYFSLLKASKWADMQRRTLVLYHQSLRLDVRKINFSMSEISPSMSLDRAVRSYSIKENGTWNVKTFVYFCWRSRSNKVIAVQTQNDSSCFMQQDTQ